MADYYKKVFFNNRNTKSAFFFENTDDIQRFGKETIDSYQAFEPNFSVVNRYSTTNLPTTVQRSISNSGERWYGTTDSSWAGSPITQFLRSSDLDDDLKKLNQSIAKVDITDLDQKKKIEFTEMELGIFSFDLASLGLIRVYEYYSPLLKRVVNPDLVQSFQNENGEDIFFYVGTPFVPRHIVPFDLKQGCYFSPILGRKVESSELEEVVPDSETQAIEFYYPEQVEIPKHNVERKQVVDEDGNKKFASTYKKCFINMPKVKGKTPRIDLIVPVTYASRINSEQIYWNTASLLSICEKLNNSGINFRVIMCIAIRNDRKKENFIFCNLKNDNENIDRNAISIAVSDARFFRTAIFQVGLSAQIESGWKTEIDSSIGFPITDQSEIKSAYIQYLSKQTDPSDIESSLMLQSKLVLSTALSEQEAIRSYQNIIQQVEGLITI